MIICEYRPHASGLSAQVVRDETGAAFVLYQKDGLTFQSIRHHDENAAVAEAKNWAENVQNLNEAVA